jgi:hypothetical protein
MQARLLELINNEEEGIDSQPGGSVRQIYLPYQPARLQRLAKSIPRNRFLGSINVYKYGLRSAGVINSAVYTPINAGIQTS